jgi:hypothetical protein
LLQTGKWHKGKRHNSICSKPESGIKERGINGKRQKIILHNWVLAKPERGVNRKGHKRKGA